MSKLLLFIIMLASFNAAAQDIPIKANVIIVHDVSFKEVINKLLDSGYYINKIDSNFNIVETEPKHPHYKSGLIQRIIVRARVKDSIATFTALYTIGDTGPVTDPVANFKIWRNNNKTPWYAFNTFALSFNKPVEYLISE